MATTLPSGEMEDDKKGPTGRSAEFRYSIYLVGTRELLSRWAVQGIGVRIERRLRAYRMSGLGLFTEC